MSVWGGVYKNIVHWLNLGLMLVKKGGYTSCAFKAAVTCIKRSWTWRD